MRIAHVALALALAVALGTPAGAQEEPVRKMKAFYFGNSFTGNTMPGLHAPLGESAGREWEVNAAISPGVPIWIHMKKLMDGERTAQLFQRNAPDTDAIVMLLFGGDGLSSVVTEKWQGKVKFEEPTDIGDVAACSYLIREYLKLNPNGRAYIYTAWPGIPAIRAFANRVKDEEIKAAMAGGKSRREVMQTIEHRELTHEELEPLRRALDYPSQWLNDGYLPDLDAETAGRMGGYARALQALRRQGETATQAEVAAAAEVDPAVLAKDMATVGIAGDPLELDAFTDAVGTYLKRATMRHCRPHMYAAMEGVIKNFPKLWAEGRLGMIPVGDVFLELDKKMKAGEVPGIVNIGQYSADGGHLRSGLPRYTLAATYYAVLFRDHPKNVDWRIFQDRANYESGKGGFYVHQPDLAVHLDITPERAAVVNDTIWEVVTNHPYAAMARPDTTEKP